MAVSLAAVAAGVLATSATATAKQSLLCSETGDVCVGLVLRADGSLVAHNMYAADYVDRAKVCWRAPGKGEACAMRPLVRSGTAWFARVVFPRPAPGRWQVGSGHFRASLTVPGRTAPAGGIRCDITRYYGTSRIVVSRVTGPVTCTAAANAARLAVAYRVQNDFPESFCTRGWCWKWKPFREIGEGASVAGFVGRRGKATIGATQQVS
ncbi:MAG: hypothetical protein AB7I08_08705 [Thermoleophilia bacterium]